MSTPPQENGPPGNRLTLLRNPKIYTDSGDKVNRPSTLPETVHGPIPPILLVK